MRLRPAVLLLFACLALGSAGWANPPARRLARLRRGVNASEWFAQVWDPKGFVEEHFRGHTTAEDVALIKAMGFDHVRLPVDPRPMSQDGRRDLLSAKNLLHLDAAVKMILDGGLAVVIDLHPESDYKARLATDDKAVRELVDFWRALASHYSSWDPERVFLELLNEPEFSDRYRWQGIQAKLAAAVRGAAPRHTLIATGARWSSDEELLLLEPLGDGNVVYAFHFYEPHIFTHQGAEWGEYHWRWVRNLRYPSDPASASRTAAGIPEPTDRLKVIRYGGDRWDAARIDSEVALVADWAKRRGVPVVCNEFGVHRAHSEPDDRTAWIKDVRSSLERHGMGWTMWDYAGGYFGLVTKKDGRAVVDDAVRKALGMGRPKASP